VRSLDRTSTRILAAVAREPLTPGQIARQHNIPVVECWHRVRRLEDLGLLRLVLVHVTSDGRTLRFFQALVSEEALVRGR